MLFKAIRFEWKSHETEFSTLIVSFVLQGFGMKKDPVGDTAGLVHFHLQLLGLLLEFGHLLLGLGRPQLHTSPVTVQGK